VWNKWISSDSQKEGKTRKNKAYENMESRVTECQCWSQERGRSVISEFDNDVNITFPYLISSSGENKLAVLFV
jgi:hypothetical protein